MHSCGSPGSQFLTRCSRGRILSDRVPVVFERPFYSTERGTAPPLAHHLPLMRVLLAMQMELSILAVIPDMASNPSSLLHWAYLQ